MMDRATLLAALRREGDALLRAAEGHLATPVPTCPGWDVTRLLGHLGRIHRWTAAHVTTGRGDIQVAQPPADDAILDWVRQGIDELVQALRGHHPGRERRATTPGGSNGSDFWPRRMAIETAVHRWDVEHAVGDPGPIDTELAVDGIDEMFDVILPWRGAGPLARSGATIHVHTTDVEGEWFVRFGEDGVEVERTHAKGDLALRGAASDLLLVLYGRRRPHPESTFGDTSLLDRWQAIVRA